MYIPSATLLFLLFEPLGIGGVVIHPVVSLTSLPSACSVLTSFDVSLIPLIAALIGLLNGSLQKEGGSIYTKRCKFLNLLPKMGVYSA